MLNYTIKYNLIEIVFLILTFNCFKCNNYSVATMADVAQLVRALVCGTRCREFESLHPPHIKKARHKTGFFYWMAGTDLNSRKESSTPAKGGREYAGRHLAMSASE